MAERHVEIARSDYQRDNQYSITHPDALAGDDAQGKGTGAKGHTHWLPDCNGEIGVFRYDNFDTAIASNSGNVDDRYARKVALARSMYNQNNVYSAKLVDTTKNQQDGQWIVKYRPKTIRPPYQYGTVMPQ